VAGNVYGAGAVSVGYCGASGFALCTHVYAVAHVTGEVKLCAAVVLSGMKR